MIIKDALANGRLIGIGADHPLAEIARDYGVTPDGIALASVLDQRSVDVVLSGAVTVDQLRNNMSAVDAFLDDKLRPSPDRIRKVQIYRFLAFHPVDPKPSFPRLEQEAQAYWRG